MKRLAFIGREDCPPCCTVYLSRRWDLEKKVDGRRKEAENRNKRYKVKKKEKKRQDDNDDEGEGREETAAA